MHSRITHTLIFMNRTGHTDTGRHRWSRCRIGLTVRESMINNTITLSFTRVTKLLTTVTHLQFRYRSARRSQDSASTLHTSTQSSSRDNQQDFFNGPGPGKSTAEKTTLTTSVCLLSPPKHHPKRRTNCSMERQCPCTALVSLLLGCAVLSIPFLRR